VGLVDFIRLDKEKAAGNSRRRLNSRLAVAGRLLA
jgi:hypothetical protein